MSYQTCPKCKGSGKSFNYTPSGCVWLDVAVTLPTIRLKKDGGYELNNPLDEKCPVCKGAMIISELTGLPPNA